MRRAFLLPSQKLDDQPLPNLHGVFLETDELTTPCLVQIVHAIASLCLTTRLDE